VHSVVQATPEHSPVHDVAALHCSLHPPPAHVVMHVARASQTKVQPPCGQSNRHVVSPAHENVHGASEEQIPPAPSDVLPSST
jgi:hypothetical protein